MPYGVCNSAGTLTELKTKIPSMTRTPAVIAAALLLVAAGCGRTDDNATPVANPRVTLSRQAANVGGPLDMTYRFAIPAAAPSFAEDYWVFVHFTDADGELIWTDDHQPPT